MCFICGTDFIQLATSQFANFACVPARSTVVGGVTLNGITTLQQSDFLFVEKHCGRPDSSENQAANSLDRC